MAVTSHAISLWFDGEVAEATEDAEFPPPNAPSALPGAPGNVPRPESAIHRRPSVRKRWNFRQVDSNDGCRSSEWE